MNTLALSYILLLLFPVEEVLSLMSPLRASTSGHTSGTCMSMAKRSDEMYRLKDELMEHINECLSGDGEGLVERPGFAYGFGLNEWSSSGYSGVVEGWNSVSRVHWVSCRVTQLDSNDDKDVSAMQVVPVSNGMLDVMVLGSRESDVPHAVMRARRSRENGALELMTDFIPRVDIIAGLDYYDKYFTKLGTAPAAKDGVKVTACLKGFGHDSSLLSRMLQSPFAYGIEINKGDEKADIQEALNIFRSHVDQWVAFWKTADIELSEAIQVNKDTRDTTLHGLLVNEEKFRLAALFGPNFAPASESLAQAVIGPSFSDVL